MGIRDCHRSLWSLENVSTYPNGFVISTPEGAKWSTISDSLSSILIPIGAFHHSMDLNNGLSGEFFKIWIIISLIGEEFGHAKVFMLHNAKSTTHWKWFSYPKYKPLLRPKSFSRTRHLLYFPRVTYKNSCPFSLWVLKW